jgi:ketosteroid isomerase-like protein
LAFEPRRVHFGADHFVSEYVMTGSAAGNQFSVDGIDVFAAADGRIARKDTYLDLIEYQRQVGLEPVASDA